MCGIAGLIGSQFQNPEHVRRMVDSMRHRGPDDWGVHAPVETVVLGSTRLSIIDLSPAGHQPMSNEDNRIWIVFNGEIYNFRDLRGDLERCGHLFRSGTDTEVIIHAYEEWGADCVHRLRGMFAFALFDGRDAGLDGKGGTIFLARDHFGIKPLYYACREGTLIFASEVRALLSSGLLSKRLSSQGLSAYLLWGSVAEPLTLVDGIRSLCPGHRLVATLNGDSLDVRTESYWRPQSQGASSRHGSRIEATAELRRVLRETVRSHLVADVPVGAFLSSGVDSTCITGLAAEAHHEIVTVTVSFPEEEGYSEAGLAQETASQLGTSHHEIALTGSEITHRLDEAVGALDQPSMDGVNTYFVSWGARQVGLKVALSGLGGDELFGGYRTFTWVPRLEMIAAFARRAPAAPRIAAASAIRNLSSLLGSDAAQKFAEVIAHPDLLPHPYAVARALYPPQRVRRLLNGAGEGGLSGPWVDHFYELVSRVGDLGPFTRVSNLELGTYLVNTLLRDTDSMSMAHSLEVRVPFIDRRVVEFVTRLPEEWRDGRSTSGARSKGLLLDAVGDLVPPSIAHQRKRTFTLPWEKWLRGSLSAKISNSIADIPETLKSRLDPREVQVVWRDFLAGRTGWARPWSLYVLNEWVRMHL